MTLPKIAVPTFKLNLPSTGQTIQYRPFLVKEEKVLMMALEGGDEDEIVTAIKSTIESCTKTKINVDELAVFDLEYFFLKMRAKSVGETVDIVWSCQKPNVEDKSKLCGTSIEFQIPIDEIEPSKNEKHTNIIELTDHVGIVMKYPQLENVNTILGAAGAENIEAVIDLIVLCVESIYDSDTTYKMKDTPIEETKEFILNLTQEQFQKIQEFFETMPKITYKNKIKCPKCKEDNDVVLEGLQSFFG